MFVILSKAKNPAKNKGCNWILRFTQNDGEGYELFLLILCRFFI